MPACLRLSVCFHLRNAFQPSVIIIKNDWLFQRKRSQAAQPRDISKDAFLNENGCRKMWRLRMIKWVLIAFGIAWFICFFIQHFVNNLFNCTL
jgi:hypothetical protein